MKVKYMKDLRKKELADDLFQVLASISNKSDMTRFMKDLCTHQEIKAFIERWHVCQLLYGGDLSYREISELTGVSLATITRVARSLKDESHLGYKNILDKMKKKKKPY